MENAERRNDEKVVRVIQLGKKVLEFRRSGEFTVGEVVDSLGIPIDRLRVDLRINGQSADTNSLLQHGDTITILPPIKGGWDRPSVAQSPNLSKIRPMCSATSTLFWARKD